MSDEDVTRGACAWGLDPSQVPEFVAGQRKAVPDICWEPDPGRANLCVLTKGHEGLHGWHRSTPNLLALLAMANEHGYYGGGPNGTCYECPYASPPLERGGRVADWHDISNDPTEAYFRCALPGRDNDAVVWGEYAPCTTEEWTEAHLTMLAEVDPQAYEVAVAIAPHVSTERAARNAPTDDSGRTL